MPWKDRRLTVFMFVRIAYLKEIKEETFIMIDRFISTVLIWEAPLGVFGIRDI